MKRKGVEVWTVMKETDVAIKEILERWDDELRVLALTSFANWMSHSEGDVDSSLDSAHEAALNLEHDQGSHKKPVASCPGCMYGDD